MEGGGGIAAMESTIYHCLCFLTPKFIPSFGQVASFFEPSDATACICRYPFGPLRRGKKISGHLQGCNDLANETSLNSSTYAHLL
jgi:hypothetical protein